MENEEVQQSDTQSSEKPEQNISGNPTRKTGQGKTRNKKKLLWIVIVVIAMLGLAAGGYYILKEPEFKDNDVINNGELSTPEYYEEPTRIPTPTQEPIEREGVSMQILNGTGIEGEASYLQGRLRNLGYEDIEVANAKNSCQRVN
jgi:hypothetical protein